MPRFTEITKQSVYAICNEMANNGEHITNATVLAKIGKGSLNTLSPLLRQWKEERLLRLQESENSVVATVDNSGVDVPDDVKVMFNTLFNSLQNFYLKRETELINGIRSEYENLLKVERNKLCERIVFSDDLMQDLKDAQNSLEIEKENCFNLINQLDKCHQEIELLKSSNDKLVVDFTQSIASIRSEYEQSAQLQRGMYSNQLNDLAAQLESSRLECARLIEQNNQLNSDLEKSRLESNKLIDKNTRLENKLIDLDDMLENSYLERSVISDQKNQLDINLSQLRLEFDNLKGQFSSQELEHLKSINDLNVVIANLKGQLDVYVAIGGTSVNGAVDISKSQPVAKSRSVNGSRSVNK